MRARELMSTPVVTVSPETPLKEVAEKMAAHAVSGVPVVDPLGRLVGIVSESDVLARLAHEKTERGLMGLLDALAQSVGAVKRLEAQTAGDLMTTRVLSAGPDASFREMLHLMTAYDVNRLPIVESDRVIGIVTRADLLRTLARPDAAVVEDARWRLLHDLWVDPAGLTVTAQQGVVAVAGEVGTRSEAELVKRWIASIEGVVDVDTRDLRYRVDDRDLRPPTGSVDAPTGKRR